MGLSANPDEGEEEEEEGAVTSTNVILRRRIRSPPLFACMGFALKV